MSKKNLIILIMAGVVFLFSQATTAVAAQKITATLTASPKSYSGPCPAVIHFNGKITVTQPGRVQYKFIRSDGASAPVKTLSFNSAGSKTVGTTWTLGGPGLPSYAGWQAIQVVHPYPVKSNKAHFKMSCRDDQSDSRKKPDLRVKFTAPSSAVAGTDIGSQVHLKVWNAGSAPAKGTVSAGANGYKVDLMLSTDTIVPPGPATYSPNFHEDVLLLGGRVSITQTLSPGQSKTYPVGAGIPADAPPGGNYLCAKVDPANKIGESNESNNVYCRRIYIKKGTQGSKNRPDLVISIINFSPGKPTTADEITFWVFVKNVGTAKAGVSKMSFKVGGETHPPIVNVPALNPGQQFRYDRKLTLRAAHNYLATAKADVGNNVIESNESNNVLSKKFRVTQAR